MAFPASPADGATTLVNGVTYVYSLANVSWSPVASVNSLAVSALTVSGNSSVTGTETVGTSIVTGNESVQGNETVSGNQIVLGNLGVGTASPAAKLDVIGALRASSLTNNISTGAFVMNVGSVNGATSSPAIALWGTSDTSYPGAVHLISQNGNIQFYNYNGSSWTENARITSSGNVGIGTSSPSRKLDIEQSSTDYQMRIGDTGSNYYDIGRNTTNGLLTFYGSQAVASGYKFSTVNGDRLTIDTSGNVIIGTTSTIGSTNFSAGSVVYSSIQQGGRSYEAHDFNSYPNLYSTIFINSGASSNVPSGFSGMGYRFIMGAGDTGTRGFDLLGSSEPALWFRERSNGVWNKVLTKPAGSLTSAAYAVSNATAITVNTATPTAICSVTITCTGKPVFITASGDGNPNQSGGWHFLQICKDGSGIGKFIINENAGGASCNCPWALTHIDVPTATQHTYAVYAWQGSGSFLYGESGDTQAPTIAVMEIL